MSSFINPSNIISTIGIVCFLVVGLIGDGWRIKSIAILFATANAIIFLK